MPAPAGDAREGVVLKVLADPTQERCFLLIPESEYCFLQKLN